MAYGFDPRDWTVGYTVTAADLTDLETRLSDYTNSTVGGAEVGTVAELVEAQGDLNADGGGNIILAPGDYAFTQENVSFNYSGITYQAAIPRKTRFYCSSTDGSDWSPMIAVIGVEDVNFKGIVFDANGQASCPVLGLRGLQDFSAENCKFIGGQLHGGIGSVYLTGGDTNAFSSAKTNNVRFERCEFGPSGDGGLGLLGGNNAPIDERFIKNVKLIDNYFHDCGKTAVILYMYNLRGIENVEIRGNYFDNNATVEPMSTNSGHVVDINRTGWVNVEVHSNTFLNTGGYPGAGAFADHAGHNGAFHHNYVDMGQLRYNQLQWTLAVGEDNDIDSVAIPFHQRTWDFDIHHNHFVGCGSFDYDSCARLRIEDNTFYRCITTPLAAFNHHFYDSIENNDFIECGQGAGSRMLGNSDAPVEGSLHDYQKSALSIPGVGITIKGNRMMDMQTGRATLTTNLTGATNNDLHFKAANDGTAGNSITVAYVVAGNNTPLSVSVTGSAITVNVATNGGGAATSTARQVQVAVNSHAVARNLVWAHLAIGNDGTGTVAAMSAASLTGGNTTPTPTQVTGIYEHGTGTGASWLPTQPPGLIEDNYFGEGIATPIQNRQTGATHPHIVRRNRSPLAVQVASVAALVLPIHGDFIEVTGTTTITSIEPEKDREVVLRFSSTAQVTDGSNLSLAGNYTGAAGRVLSLVCDGTNWYERSRTAV